MRYLMKSGKAVVVFCASLLFICMAIPVQATDQPTVPATTQQTAQPTVPTTAQTAQAKTPAVVRLATMTETPAAIKDGTANRDVRGTLPKGVFLQHSKNTMVLHNTSKQPIWVQGTVAILPGQKVNLIGDQYKITEQNDKSVHHLIVTITGQQTITSNKQSPNNTQQQNNIPQNNNIPQSTSIPLGGNN